MPRKANKVKQLEYEIDVPQLLLHSRNILLHGAIDCNVSRRICEDLLALDQVETKPIGLWINSAGGSLQDGWAIIDTIEGLSSPVYTFLTGRACSTGALIALAGERRAITRHSCWMIHDLTYGYSDQEYVQKIKDNLSNFLVKAEKMIEDYVCEKTELTRREVRKARNGELWLWADECLEKGVVHAIATERKR